MIDTHSVWGAALALSVLGALASLFSALSTSLKERKEKRDKFEVTIKGSLGRTVESFQIGREEMKTLLDDIKGRKEN